MRLLTRFAFLSPLFLFAHTAIAQTPTATTACPDGQYNLMVPLGSLSGCVTLGTYVTGLFQVLVGIAGVLAVVMLVICGIKLMTAEAVSSKEEARKCIYNAIFGLLLILGSWMLLNSINPL
jgi:type IV secretory pathway VirB2 component (pilin)